MSSTIISLIEAQNEVESEDLGKLPPEFEQNNDIETLMDGRIAYTVPWSIWVDSDGSAFINKRYQFKDEQSGTFKVRIVREGDNIVIFTDSIEGETFSRHSAPSHNGATLDDYMPVVFRRSKKR
ncbi:hypothetical protein A3H26_01415 [candidate division WWE3 bacterium RIFCSPLOWO2_12_FULL_36_10]|uniref:Uncharacterized protein n=1 Tax=candidate division WWE3 bacterium RIFCSPLOWO2_12_FULL_36_10 TaxID=1802630 RepID=A0A1F4VIZ9_UNCKA|nr:MAG: hypothetical protein A3H26_01415 [candidate division WWE3 bacterium RIFCSPLOWO2_12_FULL_36_10]